jgi:hypothetical protein
MAAMRTSTTRWRSGTCWDLVRDLREVVLAVVSEMIVLADKLDDQSARVDRLEANFSRFKANAVFLPRGHRRDVGLRVS